MITIDGLKITKDKLRELIKDNPELIEKKQPIAEGGAYYKVVFVTDILNKDFSGYFEWSVRATMYYAKNLKQANNEYHAGLAFQTEEEAQQECDKRNAEMRINQYIWENNLRIKDVDWEDGCQVKFYIRRDFGVSSFSGGAIYEQNGLEKFSELKSEEACYQIIKNCEEDLKIVFNIK